MFDKEHLRGIYKCTDSRSAGKIEGNSPDTVTIVTVSIVVFFVAFSINIKFSDCKGL